MVLRTLLSSQLSGTPEREVVLSSNAFTTDPIAAALIAAQQEGGQARFTELFEWCFERGREAGELESRLEHMDSEMQNMRKEMSKTSI